jgi:acyl transferase domain-containing protein
LEALQNDSDNTVEGRRKQLIAGVNSFGIGGTLAPVLLGEAPYEASTGLNKLFLKDCFSDFH